MREMVWSVVAIDDGGMKGTETVSHPREVKHWKFGRCCTSLWHVVPFISCVQGSASFPVCCPTLIFQEASTSATWISRSCPSPSPNADILSPSHPWLYQFHWEFLCFSSTSPSFELTQLKVTGPFCQHNYLKGLQLSCLCYTFTNLDQKSCMVWQVLNSELGRYGLWAKFWIFNSLNHWAIENIGGPPSKQSNSALLLVSSFLCKLQDLLSYFSIGV